MPRSWKRSPVFTLCGGCNGEIAVNEPVMEITSGTGGKWKLRRCRKCAGEAPPDLPPIIERLPQPAFKPVRVSRDMLPLDWKQQQLAEKE